MSRCVAGAAVFGVLSLGPSGAWADQKAGQKHYQAGLKSYNLGRFQEAIESFEKAYDEDAAAILLFNIAQSHRQLGNHERALFFYRRYLEAEPGTPKRADVERRIAEHREALEKRAQAEPPPASSTAPATVPSAAPSLMEPKRNEVPADPAVAPASPPTADEPSTSLRPLRLGAYIAGGVGVAALGTGLAFGAKAKSDGEANSMADVFDKSADDAGKRAETLQWVFLGIGAVGVAAGVTLFLIDLNRASGEADKVALSPWATGSGGGLSATGRF